MSLREATQEDARFIFDLRNSADVRDASFNSDPLDWESHLAWLENRLREATPVFIVESDRRDVGYVRVESNSEGELEMSVAIAADARARGIGRAAITLGSEAVEQGGADRILARIRPGNTGSIAAFKASGFVEEGGTGTGDEVVLTRTATG